MKITTEIIRAGMLKQFGGSEWALMWEVAPATGVIHGKTRFADAVMMSLWPSRGLDLHGVEIKVSRSDWKREAADPSKAERIAAYCDYWWVHTAPGVIHDLSEVPTNWGVREYDGTSWTTLRTAVKTDALPVDRGFLASLLRRAESREQVMIEAEVQKRVDKIQADFDRRVEERVRSATESYKEACGMAQAFKDASGISMSRWSASSEAAEIGALVKLFREVGVDKSYGGLKTVVSSLARTAESAQKAIDAYEADLKPVDNDLF